jgi:hypothetical protein
VSLLLFTGLSYQDAPRKTNWHSIEALTVDRAKTELGGDAASAASTPDHSARSNDEPGGRLPGFTLIEVSAQNHPFDNGCVTNGNGNRQMGQIIHHDPWLPSMMAVK